MSGSGKASVGQASAKVAAIHAGKAPAQQHGKERPGGYYFTAPLQNPRISGPGGCEAMPEWKLNCLCADYGLPPTVRGHMPMGGCF